jgi:hypothetical protein
MAPPKSEKRSSDLDAEIARLKQERNRAVQAEDQRRGAIIRTLLSGAAGDALRSTLQPLVGARDAFLFGLEVSGNGKQSMAEHNPGEPVEWGSA